METTRFMNKLALTGHRSIFNNITTIIGGSVLLALASQVIIPLNPVPITLQSFAVLFAGMAFGPRIGGAIVFTYLCEGICGFPVFANFSWGLHVFFEPSGGYLLGFVPATILVGYLLQKGRTKNKITIFLTALLGTMVLFISGYLALAYFVGFYRAYLLGIAPFIIIEFSKLIIFTFITPFFWKPINFK